MNKIIDFIKKYFKYLLVVPFVIFVYKKIKILFDRKESIRDSICVKESKEKEKEISDSARERKEEIDKKEKEAISGIKTGNPKPSDIFNKEIKK